ncbi:F5/8 type C domain protein [Planctomycetes bacterium Pan216]|uniref:F5/8 type C domain protein n=1 Tax=Kolteria novifilia TaxID=2527975 RepID=A0A518B2D1_9BACT|nr:F5/8 type C domain protein [Planctomycetes bacterium Pan216]
MANLALTRTRTSLALLLFATIVALAPPITSTGLAADAPTTEDRIDFEKQVAPIFEQHCVRCHNPGNEKGDVSLSSLSDLLENEYVVAGDPDSSYLVDLITAVGDAEPEMPKESEPLTKEQVELVRRWITEGATWPESVVVREPSKADSSWWSLQSLASVEPPSLEGLPEGWHVSPIDCYVFAKLAEKKLHPNPPADRRELIRRATYDLHGLPPTPEEVEEFVNDADPNAYEKLLDRLLDSPRYGERWGRHWLDVVRFGESNGFERNVIINELWPFRDYVIRSLNADKPFDQFIREHLAGDVIDKNEPNVVVGSAFLVAGPYDNVGNQDRVQAAQIRANTIDEMIRATGEAFLGLTVGCARCHDHKFDPIRQTDYYSLYATFAGIRHGTQVVATPEQRTEHAARLNPLKKKEAELTKCRQEVNDAVLRRKEEIATLEATWPRPPIARTGTEETFEPVTTRFVRLVSEGKDTNPGDTRSFRVDEFEIWSSGEEPRNVALASHGAKASGPSRQIVDFPGAYGPHLAIDGKLGKRFFATGGYLTIEFPAPTAIDRISFSSARGEANPGHGNFSFLAEYRIEVSDDGKTWKTIATSHDRKPVNNRHREHRIRTQLMTPEEKSELVELDRDLQQVRREIRAIPPLPRVFVGSRQSTAKQPFHVFLGGSPQKKGERVAPASFSALEEVTPPYALDDSAPEATRRTSLADWIVHPDNPLTPRVLVNRLWHYHFGTGIVATPSDFGYMGVKPTHPELLDWLARQLQEHGWRLKPMHKQIMMSQAYRQSSDFQPAAAEIDGDARLLWRFPPKRLSAEEIRDSLLTIAGVMRTEMGGPGFRLYQYLQDNVATYVPLDEHGPETYRRAVYHQNARASVIDLMTEFDQPDCAYSAPRRAETTTPLQALTMLNHDFTLDMAGALADRLKREAGDNPYEQIKRAYQLCYSRTPTDQEMNDCKAFVEEHGLFALCRVLLNTSELIYVK